MLINKKNSIYSGLIYLASNIAVAMLPLLLLPILTRYLTVEEYGVIAVFNSIMSLFTNIISTGVSSSSNVMYYESNHNESIMKRYISSVFFVLLVNVLLVFLFCFLFLDFIGTNISHDIIYIAIVSGGLSNVITLRLSQWQIRKKPINYFILQITQSLSNLIFSLILVVIFNYGYLGRVYGQFISIVIVFVISLYVFKRNGLISISKINKEHIMKIYKFGLPLIPHFIGLFFLSSYDKLYLSSKLGLDFTGVYAVAAQVGAGITLIYDAANKVTLPLLYESLSKGISKNKIVRYCYGYFLIIILSTLVLFIFGSQIISLLAGEKYIVAGSVIGWLALGHAFGAIEQMFTNYIFYAKKTISLTFTTILSGVLNILFLIFFVDIFGVIGAGYAFCIVMFIRMLVTSFLSNKVYPMPWINFIINRK